MAEVRAAAATSLVKPRKVCVVGSTGHRHVTCIGWETTDDINLVDFDVVVIVVGTLAEPTWPKAKRFCSQLARLLASGGNVLVFGDHWASTAFAQSRDLYSTNYAWSPINLTTTRESGDTIEIMENRFPKLFSQLVSWDFYYTVPDNGNWRTAELLEAFNCDWSELEFLPGPLILNRYNQPLAISLLPLLVNSQRPFGTFTLLPCIRQLDEREAVNLLLEDLLGLPQESLPPEWAENVPMPGTLEIQAEIDSKRARIEALEAEIAQHQREKQEIEKFKKLLYGDGKELEDIFSLCLEKLGGKVKEAKYSEEEFILEYKGELYLVECKGVGKSIALGHVRQLLDYIVKFEEDEGKPGKGILFGNAWKGLPLQERETASTVSFPENVINRASAWGIALIDSMDFFHAYTAFLAGKVSGESILDRITGSTGVISFQNGD
jgi:hypothetical protein